MKTHEIKDLMIRSLELENDPGELSRQIRSATGDLDFGVNFAGKVMDRIYQAGGILSGESEFVRNLTFVFYRIALTGIAAIILLLFSIYLTEGSISLDSFLGLGNGNEESIISLLTGN
jgi:hypothetical protein